MSYDMSFCVCENKMSGKKINFIFFLLLKILIRLSIRLLLGVLTFRVTGSTFIAEDRIRLRNNEVGLSTFLFSFVLQRCWFFCRAFSFVSLRFQLSVDLVNYNLCFLALAIAGNMALSATFIAGNFFFFCKLFLEFINSYLERSGYDSRKTNKFKEVWTSALDSGWLKKTLPRPARDEPSIWIKDGLPPLTVQLPKLPSKQLLWSHIPKVHAIQ